MDLTRETFYLRFRDIIYYGIQNAELPEDLVMQSERLFTKEFKYFKNDISVKYSDSFNEERFTREVGELALMIQCFSVFNLGYHPTNFEIICITNHRDFNSQGIKPRSVGLFSEEEYLRKKEYYKKVEDLLRQLATAREIDTTVEGVSIKIRHHKPNDHKDHENLRKDELTLKLPPVLLEEFIRTLEQQLRQFNLRIDFYKNLKRKKEYQLGLLIQLIKMPTLHYLRERAFPNNIFEGDTLQNEEAFAIGLVLVAAGFLPTREQYLKAPEIKQYAGPDLKKPEPRPYSYPEIIRDEVLRVDTKDDFDPDLLNTYLSEILPQTDPETSKQALHNLDSLLKLRNR